MVQDVGYLAFAVLAVCVASPFLHTWAWCLADLRHQQWLDAQTRRQWLVALLFLSIIAIPLYVSTGPGRERWDPRLLWWPWRR